MYLIIRWDHVGNVADGEGLTRLEVEHHRWAHPWIRAGKHHELHPQRTRSFQSYIYIPLLNNNNNTPHTAREKKSVHLVFLIMIYNEFSFYPLRIWQHIHTAHHTPLKKKTRVLYPHRLLENNIHRTLYTIERKRQKLRQKERERKYSFKKFGRTYISGACMLDYKKFQLLSRCFIFYNEL